MQYIQRKENMNEKWESYLGEKKKRKTQTEILYMLCLLTNVLEEIMQLISE